jgi:hypothetical protein
LLLLHQHQQCRSPLFPLQGNPRLPGTPSLARPLRIDANLFREDVQETTSPQHTVINIADLQPPNQEEVAQGEQIQQAHLQQQEQEDPIPLPHESELQVGLLAGTVAWGPPKQVEVSGSLFGGILQLGTEIPLSDFLVNPLQTIFVVVLASVLALVWDMCLTPFRQACAQ